MGCISKPLVSVLVTFMHFRTSSYNIRHTKSLVLLLHYVLPRDKTLLTKGKGRLSCQELKRSKSISCLCLKSITSRILSVAVCKTQHSMLAPPPRLKAHVLLVVPHVHDLAPGRYIFMAPRTLHPVGCYWLGATHHCPKVDAQKRRTQ